MLGGVKMSTETNTSIATQTVDDFLFTTLNKCITSTNHLVHNYTVKNLRPLD